MIDQENKLDLNQNEHNGMLAGNPMDYRLHSNLYRQHSLPPPPACSSSHYATLTREGGVVQATSWFNVPTSSTSYPMQTHHSQQATMVDRELGLIEPHFLYQPCPSSLSSSHATAPLSNVSYLMDANCFASTRLEPIHSMPTTTTAANLTTDHSTIYQPYNSMLLAFETAAAAVLEHGNDGPLDSTTLESCSPYSLPYALAQQADNVPCSLPCPNSEILAREVTELGVNSGAPILVFSPAPGPVPIEHQQPGLSTANVAPTSTSSKYSSFKTIAV